MWEVQAHCAQYHLREVGLDCIRKPERARESQESQREPERARETQGEPERAKRARQQAAASTIST